MGIDFFGNPTGINAETAKHNPVNTFGNAFLRGTNKRYIRARCARPYISLVSLAIEALLWLLMDICITVSAIALFRLPKKSMPIRAIKVQSVARPDKVTGNMRKVKMSKKV
jgi:hypothetical protein